MIYIADIGSFTVRTLIDIPEEELDQLTRLSKTRKVSRAHLVRCAVSEYLKREKQDTLDAAFGMWADRGIDGLEYQLRIRSEWDRES